MTFTPRFSTLQDLFAQATSIHAERPLFGTKRGERWVWTTYGDFARDVAQLRAALASHGVRKGDRVAIIADNRVEWAVACHAAAGLGAPFVPMYEAQLPKDWAFILRDCGARALFVANAAIAEQIATVRDELPELQHVFVLDGDDGASDWADLLARGQAEPVDPTPIEPDDTAGFIYTSGTTGDPKGVLLSHRNLASNASAALDVYPIRPDDRSLSFLPWAHSYGQVAELHTLMGAGASMALAEAVSKIVANLAEVQPTLLVSVPRIFNRIYDGVHRSMAEAGGARQWIFQRAIANGEEQRTLAEQGSSSWRVDLLARLYDRLVFSKVRARFGGRLQYAISGGAALSPAVGAFISTLGITVFEGYGLTETSPVVAANAPDARRLGTVGKPLPGVRVVLDHDITDDPVDGEIIVYGHNVMQGYFGLPAENERVFTADGGLRTGDMGRLDDDGYLRITGRIKEQYKLENGKYVVPTPLEEQLKLAPLVANALVYGANRPYNIALIVPDWEAARSWAASQGLPQEPAALIGHPMLQSAIEEQVWAQAEDFKHYERPRRIGLVDSDFTTENGMLTPSLKVKRRVVLQHYQALVASLYD